MRAKPESDWKDYNVTARDLIVDSEIYITFSCAGCRMIREANVWKIGARPPGDAIAVHGGPSRKPELPSCARQNVVEVFMNGAAAQEYAVGRSLLGIA